MPHPSSSNISVAPPQRQRRTSVANRVLLAFALVAVFFSLVAGWSVAAQRAAARDVEVIRSGYLPLALALRDAVAGQDTYNTQLNHVTTARNPADKRVWFDTTLQVARPKLFNAVRRALSRVFTRGDPELAAVGEEFLRETRGIEVFLASDRELISQLFAALKLDDRARAEQLRDELVDRGHLGSKRLGGLEEKVQRNIAMLLDEARARERWALSALVGSAILTFLIGLAAALYVRRVLRPLSQVTARANAVARGDLSPKQPIASHDEIGELSETFEAMVAAIAQANAELLSAERLATIGKMAAHITHEVRNPLSSLALNVELLEEELANDAEESRALLTAIRTEIDRLTALSERYLSVARRTKPKLEPEDLEQVVRSALDSMRPDLALHGVRTSIAAQPGLPGAMVDEGQIRQVLINLVRNAREAMPAGGKIDVSIAERDGMLELAVEDSGQGIDEETQQRLFEPFFTTKGHQGTGLGLAITREVIEAHGGTIEYQAREPHGSRFVIRLPRSGLKLEGLSEEFSTDQSESPPRVPGRDGLTPD